MKKTILEVVHESSKGLQDAGVMNEETMREFDALCLPPVKEFSASEIKKLRTKNHVSPKGSAS